MISYELPPYRPPSEARSLPIRATRNCPWNRCAFCSRYKGSTLELRPVAEVEQDIMTAKRMADEVRQRACGTRCGDHAAAVATANGIPWLREGEVRNAFIGDADSMFLKTEDLAEMIGFLYETFPTLETVTAYGGAKTLADKGREELRTLRQAGLTTVHLELETGDDELLQYMSKGATAEQMIIGGRKAIEAGFELSGYVMPGLGGLQRWEQHARETAHVLNQINPHFVRLRTLGLSPDMPLHDRQQRGQFTMQSLEGLVIEVRTMIENLEVDSQVVASDFSANLYLLDIDGRLPKGKYRMLRALDSALEMAR